MTLFACLTFDKTDVRHFLPSASVLIHAERFGTWKCVSCLSLTAILRQHNCFNYPASPSLIETRALAFSWNMHFILLSTFALHASGVLCTVCVDSLTHPWPSHTLRINPKCLIVPDVSPLAASVTVCNSQRKKRRGTVNCENQLWTFSFSERIHI